MEKPKSILLIEDDEDDQYFFKQVILQIGSITLYHIAGNGREALNMLKLSTTLPDFIFTDVNMPVMDGIECLTEIAKIPLIRDIPVVVLSSDTSHMDLFTQMGVRAFIKKPDDNRILKSLVEGVLSKDFMRGLNFKEFARLAN
jgi:CheY-like chemotaxis protein